MTLTLRYDPLDPGTLSDPYPLYAELRKNTPVFWHEQMQSWVLTRYRDCREVLRNYELFARDRRRVGEDVPEFRQSVQSMDPPEQSPLRTLLLNSLRAQDLDEISRRSRLQIEGLFARLADRAEFDFMSEVAAPIALTITSDLLGVEEPELKSYMALSDAIARRMDAGLLPSTIEAGDRARNQLNALVDAWLEGEERPGVLASVRRNAGKAQVPEHYIRNTTGVVFNASYGTLFATLGNVVLTLLQRPDALERLRDKSLLAPGVDELIRFDGPAQGTSRVATKRTTIGDTVIEPGQIVMTLLASANRDPEEFPRPDELVLDRSPNRHLAFGWGPHACLGAMFGRIALRELIVGLLATPAPLRLAGTPTRRRTATVRSMDVLPVTFRR
ncbi:cytochrome P450 [Polyangium aurulentum]|uniref:cytochrome P450 n=1 Tax=Polyangium aurulentum TaxID=2567896 RepID=UPI0010AE323E|nr:cytochrome P450 [Polyangium aurulentum]UQA61793.1 cytochrome P450 [Polyangium aurulentum]